MELYLQLDQRLKYLKVYLIGEVRAIRKKEVLNILKELKFFIAFIGVYYLQEFK